MAIYCWECSCDSEKDVMRADLFFLTENKGEKEVLICVCFSELQMVLVLHSPKKKHWFDFLTYGFVVDLSTVYSEVACAVPISCCLSGPDTSDSPVIITSSLKLLFCHISCKSLKDKLLGFVCGTVRCHADCFWMRVTVLSHTAFLQGCHASPVLRHCLEVLESHMFLFADLKNDFI